MPNYTIEMLWRCRFCQEAKNKGLSKHCLKCGHPKDAQDEEFFPDDTTEANAITDSAKLREARAPGPNWECKFCHSLQSALNACCVECGCDRATGSRLWEAKLKTIDRDTGAVTEETVVVPKATEIPDPPPPPARPSHHTISPAAKVTVPAAPVVPATPPPKTYREPPSYTRTVPERDTGWPPRVRVENRPAPYEPIDPSAFKPSRTPLVAIAAAGALALLFVCIFLGTRTDDTAASRQPVAHEVQAAPVEAPAPPPPPRIVEGTVTEVSWRHTVVIDRYHLTDHEGWTVPSNAEKSRSDEMREHHKEHVRVGSHPEPYTVKCACSMVKGACQTIKGQCSTIKGACQVTKGACSTVKGKCSMVKGTCSTIKGACRTTPRVCKATGKGTADCSGGDKVCDPDTKSCERDHEECERDRQECAPDTKTCEKDRETCEKDRQECAPDFEKCDTCTKYKDVDDYQDVPRFQKWYTWQTWEWTSAFRSVSKTGSDMKTTWPTGAALVVRLARGEQEQNHREESYQVIVAYDEKSTYTMTLRSEAEFQRFPVGTKLQLKVSYTGEVEVLPSGQ